jgi:hypothetical protein
MDFWGTVLVLFRRWYVAIPAFLLSVAAAFGVYTTIPTVYVSTSVLMLTTPTTGGSLPANPRIPNELTNPMLHFDNGLSVSASILIAALGTPDMAAELGIVPGGETEYKVTNGSSNLESLASGPLLFVEGDSRTPEGATAIVRKVVERAKTELDARQKAVHAPRATYITMYEAVPPTTPTPQKGRKLRGFAAALGIGLVGSLCATFAVESLVAARRARRRLRSLVSGTPAGPASGERVVASAPGAVTR